MLVLGETGALLAIAGCLVSLIFHSGAERSCFEELAPSARAGWNRAVDYYAESVDASDLWTGRWARFREPVWPASMEGRSDLDRAALLLMKAVSKTEGHER